MSAEYAADRVLDALSKDEGFELHDSESMTDMKSGGEFFDFTLRGKTYEVLIVEYVGGDR